MKKIIIFLCIALSLPSFTYASVQDVLGELLMLGVKTVVVMGTATTFVLGVQAMHTNLSSQITSNDNNIEGKSFSVDVVNEYIGDMPKEVDYLLSYFRSPERFLNLGLKAPKGILLVGPPGSGKSMLAYVIATKISLINGYDSLESNFFQLSAPDLHQKYVGESEKYIAQLFQKAAKAAAENRSKTAFIFLDEIDSLGNRNTNNNNGYNSLINKLLCEMDGFSKKKDINVVVLAATNHLDKVDPALYRLGRMDYIIEVKPMNKKQHVLFMEKLKQRNKTVNTVDQQSLGSISYMLGLSPADIAQLFNDAGYEALYRKKTVRDHQSFISSFFNLSDFKGEKICYHQMSLLRLFR